MNKRLILITAGIILMLLVGVQIKQHFSSNSAFSSQVIQYGAFGKDVEELQGRLRFLGYYYGDIDGDFGYNTLKSVKWFQSEFGIDVDGIAGPKTKLRLWEATKNWRPTAADVPGGAGAGGAGAGAGAGGAGAGAGAGAAEGGGGGAGGAAVDQAPTPTYSSPASSMGVSENDLRLMANAVHGESRGEPYVGQVAVAAVILNRVKSPSFPNTISGVIFQPGAFTAVADGQIWLTPDASSTRAVRDALNGWDPSGGCIYYFNPATATSKWIWSRPQAKTIGKHIFCK